MMKISSCEAEISNPKVFTAYSDKNKLKLEENIIQTLSEMGMIVGKGSTSAFMPLKKDEYNALIEARVTVDDKVTAYYKKSKGPGYFSGMDQLALVKISNKNF
ncbi:MAG: hypothetical protein JSW73_02520 [Candidatus Woesearchaeota archaeon]|nr:MAG: hypothetical protein JSW73_02520 [Candidatus Woesearchaeota archaeon]